MDELYTLITGIAVVEHRVVGAPALNAMSPCGKDRDVEPAGTAACLEQLAHHLPTNDIQVFLGKILNILGVDRLLLKKKPGQPEQERGVRTQNDSPLVSALKGSLHRTHITGQRTALLEQREAANALGDIAYHLIQNALEFDLCQRAQSLLSPSIDMTFAGYGR